MRSPAPPRSAAAALPLPRSALLCALLAAAPSLVCAQYGNMVVTTYPNGVESNPLGEPAGTIPLSVNPSTGQAINWAPSAAVPLSVLANATSSQCLFMESAFEDGFQYPSINLTRWKPVAATALDHCPKPGAVGAANPMTCTAMMSSQMQFGVPLPGYPTGDLGLIMTLSQTPCQTPGACCVGATCANWAGAHLSSNGCIHYGVLETEAAFNIPPANGGVFFAGTYMYGGNGDPSWNEIDQTIINGPAGLEFHGSLFLSNPPYQSSATEDKDVFDATGTACNSYVPPAGQAGNLRGSLKPYTCPPFGTQYASSYHTYKLVWTPNWLAWLIDTTVYRNSTAAPWRPVTMRPLLRTNVGTAASVAVLPDAQVFIRRVRYTPLDAAGTVVSAALKCVSMAACFGNMATNAAGMLQLSTPTMATTAAAVGRHHRRQLLQGIGPTLSTTGAQLSTPTGPVVLTPYEQELANVSNATQIIVAGVLQGVLPSQVLVSITGHTISGVMYASGFAFSAWTPAVQDAFVRGLATDVVPTPDQVYVSGALDASLPASWASAAGMAMPSGAAGVLISYIVDGYQCDPAATTPCTDAGFSVATSDTAVLNSIGPSNAVSASVRTLIPAVVFTDASPGSPAAPQYPTISATVGVGINIFAPANGTALSNSSSSPKDVLEAMFESALASGAISAALAAANIGSATAPTNVQTARATRAADAASGCPAFYVPPDPYLTCPELVTREEVYKAVMIAFIVAFVLSVMGFFGGMTFMYLRLRTMGRGATRNGRIPDFDDDALFKGAPQDKLHS